MFEAKYDVFGASTDDVLANLPRAGYGDVATIRREVQDGSTQTTIVVDSTVGLLAGDRVHAPIADHGEVREIDQITSGTTFSVTEAFSAVPEAGTLVDDGPECIRRELVRAESFVVSKLPERYRKLLGRVDGEIIVRRAEGGQDSALLGLATASSVKLYKNFTGILNELGPENELPAGLWTREGQTITFDPALIEGDRVMASYDVAVGAIGILQTLVVDLATFRVGRRLVGQFEQVTPEWLLSFRDRGEETIEEIFSSARGVSELDELDLYEDWERGGRGVRSGVVDKA